VGVFLKQQHLTHPENSISESLQTSRLHLRSWYDWFLSAAICGPALGTTQSSWC